MTDDAVFLQQLQRLHDAEIVNEIGLRKLVADLHASRPLTRDHLVAAFGIERVSPLLITPGGKADRVLLAGELSDLTLLLREVETCGFPPLDHVVQACLRIVAVLRAQWIDQPAPAAPREPDPKG